MMEFIASSATELNVRKGTRVYIRSLQNGWGYASLLSSSGETGWVDMRCFQPATSAATLDGGTQFPPNHHEFINPPAVGFDGMRSRDSKRAAARAQPPPSSPPPLSSHQVPSAGIGYRGGGRAGKSWEWKTAASSSSSYPGSYYPGSPPPTSSSSQHQASRQGYPYPAPPPPPPSHHQPYYSFYPGGQHYGLHYYSGHESQPSMQQSPPHGAQPPMTAGLQDEALAKLLVAWYYSGYHTGRYKAMKEIYGWP
mmetsp:Transcript_31197/g.50680  ORF Transcript_31197/g.50680 Transcript_31197/m.50680 type:complete len:252 (-) Transcript_31197:105-860(-)